MATAFDEKHLQLTTARPGTPGLVRQLRLLQQSPSGARLFRYLRVSVISSSVYFAALLVVYGVLRMWSEVPCAIFANVIAGIPAYFLYRNWVWGRSGRSHLMGEVVPFWVVTIVGALATIIAAAEARQLGIGHHLGHGLRTALLLGVTAAAFVSLWIVKFLIFHRLFHVEERPSLADADAV